jgi:methylated-DNA-[protein]-cysteine S-methyltransferase
MTIQIAQVSSPIGRITLAVRAGRLCALEFSERWPRARARLERRFGAVAFHRAADPGGVAGRLRAYFAGDLSALARVRVDPGGTPFQRRVWRALRRIAAGRTIAYRELARTIGEPAAVRAVGTANGANPISIVVPCHRVVAADGGLGGYSGGLERKRWLLRHEGADGS